jgi:GxxExxY protein
VVNQLVLLELKAIAKLEASQEAQLLNYLRATDFEIGLLLNFGPKAEIKRRILDNDRKPLRVVVKQASQA